MDKREAILVRLVEIAGTRAKDRREDECEDSQLRDRMKNCPQRAADAAGVTVAQFPSHEAREKVAACIQARGYGRWHVASQTYCVGTFSNAGSTVLRKLSTAGSFHCTLAGS